MITAERLEEKLKQAKFTCPGGGLFADERGVSFLLDIKRRTLSAWRARGYGPPAVRIGRWLYDLEALAAWINVQQEHASARSDVPPPAPAAIEPERGRPQESSQHSTRRQPR